MSLKVCVFELKGVCVFELQGVCVCLNLKVCVLTISKAPHNFVNYFKWQNHQKYLFLCSYTLNIFLIFGKFFFLFFFYFPYCDFKIT